MTTKFELTEKQQARMDAWFKYHWDVIHSGWLPKDRSSFAGFYRFGPSGEGCVVDYECAYCPQNIDHQIEVSNTTSVDLTIDDDGEFIFEYDEKWHKITPSWEKKT